VAEGGKKLAPNEKTISRTDTSESTGKEKGVSLLENLSSKSIGCRFLGGEKNQKNFAGRRDGIIKKRKAKRTNLIDLTPTQRTLRRKKQADRKKDAEKRKKQKSSKKWV